MITRQGQDSTVWMSRTRLGLAPGPLQAQLTPPARLW
jgi:hypothetical protein